MLAQERARALRERAAHVTQAEEEERRRMLREIHDELGPSPAAIGNRIKVCRSMLRINPDAAEAQLTDIEDSIKGHIREIRGLIHDLRPLALDQLGPLGAVRQQAERLGQETGAQAVVSASGDIALDTLGEMTVFRVVQECLNNIREHAGASLVGVNIRAGDRGVEVVVEDNGHGFEPDEAPPSVSGKGGAS